MGVLQRFERRLEGMVGLAFARIFKGKVHPAEIAKALQREADEQKSVLGRTDFEHLGQWSDQLADELADMVAEHIDDEGYQVFDKVTVRLEQDTDLPTGVFEVSSHVADPARVLRQQRIHRVRWFDPESGAHMEMTVPQEDVRFLELDTY